MSALRPPTRDPSSSNNTKHNIRMSRGSSSISIRIHIRMFSFDSRSSISNFSISSFNNRSCFSRRSSSSSS